MDTYICSQEGEKLIFGLYHGSRQRLIVVSIVVATVVFDSAFLDRDYFTLVFLLGWFLIRKVAARLSTK